MTTARTARDRTVLATTPLAITLVAAALLAGCAAADPDAASRRPSLHTLEDLLADAIAGKPYLEYTTPDGTKKTAVPMTAVVTPPGGPVLFRSPPFAPAATVNAEAGPQLNLLPGLAAGRAIPYVTMELWKNDFGPIWTQPVYYVRDETDPSATVQPAIFGTDRTHRFYSPFWRVYDVHVPHEVAERVRGAHVKSVAEVLALGGRVVKGPLRLCPVAPPEVVVDPAIRRNADGTVPAGPPPVGAFPGVWDDVYRAEYTDEGLARVIRPRMGTNGAYFEGRPVSFVGFGDDYARELPGEVIEANPIYVWVDLQSNGAPRPLGLPTVAAHGPAFSGRPVLAPNGKPDWFALWEVVFTVRPAGAEPFVPAPTDGSPDPFEAGGAESLRAVWKARKPAAEVLALPGVARYVGRLATNPSCFDSADAAQTGDPLDPVSTRRWAESCGFLDAQEKVEAAVRFEGFLKTGVQALCMFLLWSRDGEVRP